MTIDTIYNDNPWSGLSQNQRDWYVPALLDVFRAKSIYRQFVPMQVDLNAQRTKKMIFNLVYDLEPNTTPLDARAKWVDGMRSASSQLEITTEHHGGKIQMEDYDDMITYWQEGGVVGLMPIIRNRLAPAIVEHLDKLARNAYLQGTFNSVAMGDAASWNALADGNVFDIDWALDAQLRAMTSNLPGFQDQAGSIVCVTTPGALYQVQKSPEWIALNDYSESGRTALLAAEVGSYKGVRFVPTTANILWNAGAITKRVNVTSAITAGDGQATWGTYKPDTAFTNYVQCSSFGDGEFAVNDVVTIHTAVTSAHGVTDGVNPYHGKTVTRVVKYVNHSTDRLAFDKPILMDYAVGEAETGVAAYITKGRSVHASVFMYGPSGVVAGVSQPVRLVIPPAFDDLMRTRRFAWDAYIKYQEFRPEMFEVVFHSGQHRINGAASY